jgi:hypothetical protein
MGNALINDDPFEPSAKHSGIFQLLNFSKGGNKSFLELVMRISFIAAKTNTHIIHGLAILLVEGLLCRQVTFFCAFYKRWQRMFGFSQIAKCTNKSINL